MIFPASFSFVFLSSSSLSSSAFSWGLLRHAAAHFSRKSSKMNKAQGQMKMEKRRKKTLLPCQRFSNCHRALKRHISEGKKGSRDSSVNVERGKRVYRERGRAVAFPHGCISLQALLGTCHYLLYSSSPFITKYFSSFICCCLHVVAGRKKKETLSHIPRQPAYLQLFDCLTQRQKMAAATAAKEVAIWITLHAHHYLPENNNNAAIAASTVFQPHLSG